ncbi:hypothetical protein FJZ31_41655 [Candidatus Poribacteria bacterium]|nr:hypothetical protein [Candidatus Poribacteria bacterium]
MKKLILYFILGLILTGCGLMWIVLPKPDLTPYKKVGVITFTLENAKGPINTLVTQYFVEEVAKSYPGVQFLELGELSNVLKVAYQHNAEFAPNVWCGVGPGYLLNEKSRQTTINGEDAQIIGQYFGIPAIFVGLVTASDFRLWSEAYAIPGLTADVRLTIWVQLWSTETGRILWEKSTWAMKRFGRGGLPMIESHDNKPYFLHQNPEEGYGCFLRPMTRKLTRDFR